MADCIYPLFLIADVVVVIAARFPFTSSSWRAHHCVCAVELCVRGGLSLSLFPLRLRSVLMDRSQGVCSSNSKTKMKEEEKEEEKRVSPSSFSPKSLVCPQRINAMGGFVGSFFSFVVLLRI